MIMTKQAGRWRNTWDGENRLVSMSSLSGAPSGSLLQLNFFYDYMGRRIQKIVSTNNGSSYVGEYTNTYRSMTGGGIVISARNPSLVLSNSLMWGSDLSGSQQGAGGVSGLIKVAYYGAATTELFCRLRRLTATFGALDQRLPNGTTLANHDYGPFGELIRMSGEHWALFESLPILNRV